MILKGQLNTRPFNRLGSGWDLMDPDLIILYGVCMRSMFIIKHINIKKKHCNNIYIYIYYNVQV